MQLHIHEKSVILGRKAGQQAGDLIAAAIAKHGSARIVIATGASQFETIAALISHHEVDWRRVECFHLDEYVGIRADHPASFRRYLNERFVERVLELGSFIPINGDAADPDAECARLNSLLATRRIDVLLLGIGENGHLAFNDPPASPTTQSFLTVDLDEACRRQQFGEGWFPSLEAVPKRAITMSVHCILSASDLVASVPDARKAAALRDCLEGPIGLHMPGSMLRSHGRCSIHVDRAAASLLSPSTRSQANRA